MSVPSWLRNISKVKFIWETYQLNVELGRMVNNHIPKKYKTNYGDTLINSSAEALKLLLDANTIVIDKNITEKDFVDRENGLRKAKVLIDYVGIYFAIAYDICKNNGEVKNENYYKDCEYIGDQVELIINLITNLEESDRKRYRQLKQAE